MFSNSKSMFQQFENQANNMPPPLFKIERVDRDNQERVFNEESAFQTPPMSPVHRGEKQIFNAPKKACYFYEDQLMGKDTGSLYYDTTEYESYNQAIDNIQISPFEFGAPAKPFHCKNSTEASSCGEDSDISTGATETRRVGDFNEVPAVSAFGF